MYICTSFCKLEFLRATTYISADFEPPAKIHETSLVAGINVILFGSINYHFILEQTSNNYTYCMLTRKTTN